jgi:hypothetical protein
MISVLFQGWLFLLFFSVMRYTTIYLGIPSQSDTHHVDRKKEAENGGKVAYQS